MLKAKGMLLMFGALIFALVGCGPEETTDDDGDTIPDVIREYGGSEPVGDLIMISVNETDQTISYHNYTTGVEENDLIFSDYSFGGFSIIKKVEVSDLQPNGGYVLFAEYPGAALVYQVFAYTNSAQDGGEEMGEPAYVVYRKDNVASDFYEKAYNWMYFRSDNGMTNADMEAGFLAVDDSAANGYLYGAGYSHRNEIEGVGSNGISFFNPGALELGTDFEIDSTSGELVLWDGSPGDFSNAVSLTGDPDKAFVIDMGPGATGGAGIAIPQSALEITDIQGTYFAISYTCGLSNTNSDVSPTKLNIDGDYIRVYDDPTNKITDEPSWVAKIIKANEFDGGPESPATQFTESVSNYSDIELANSSAISDSWMCKGSFVLSNTNAAVAGEVMFMLLDPDAKYMGFSGIIQGGPSSQLVNFGFAIKDENYSEDSL